MRTYYDPDLKAHLTLDDDRRVRHILHTQEYFLSGQSNSRLAAQDYLRVMAGTSQIPASQLKNLHLQTSFLDPREQEVEYRAYEAKRFFAASTYGYYQTIHNTPVWRGGVTVTVKDNPCRIVHSEYYGHDDLTASLPNAAAIAKLRTAMVRLNSAGQAARYSLAAGERVPRQGVPLANLFDLPKNAGNQAGWLNRARITRALFYIYRYEAGERQPKLTVYPPWLDPRKDSRSKPADGESRDIDLTLPLPAVPPQVKTGTHYLVAEIVFRIDGVGKDALKWKALVDVATGAILWLRAMTSGVNGLVFTYDPKTSTGNLGNTAGQPDAVLNPLRDDVTLLDLNAPMAGTQSLAGTHVMLSDDDAPTVAAPTQPAGNDFDYNARTNDFAAVNAYYHTNNVFRLIEDLGFNLATYFDTTAFPVHVDHRASFGTVDGVEINAFCNGDGPGGSTGDGIGMVGFCLSDDTVDIVNPLGRSVDKWVHWHELGGHGILWDHVNSANLGFAHSMGDSLAAFQNDPESLLRPLPERFQYAPFRTWPAGSERFFNRPVNGWGWGGVNDDGGYKTEQIIATTLFRVYQSLGGDSTDVNKRWQASRTATYLLLNAVGHMTPGTNPASPLALYNKFVESDTDDWVSEGWAGGAYNKVLRWSFEKQGLFRAPGAMATDPGAPPAVDLYIDDGRGGEYPYQPVHWENQSVWNSQSLGGVVHENALEAGPNYAYVRVKNRGTTDAGGIVKLYHCKPGAGLTWPTDFDQIGPVAGLPTGNVQASNGNTVTVGPFNWIPNINVYGHDCLLAIVTAAGDASNVDNLEPGQTIQEWRLVPHDNNVGQRNVNVTPGGGGGEALMASLDGAMFFAGNNFNRPASMEVRAELPKVLTAKGWRLEFSGIAGDRFVLKAGEKREIGIRLSPGAEFTGEEIRATADRNIRVYLYGNGMLMGGMTYQMDPDLKTPSGGKSPRHPQCNDAAQNLIDCLKVSGTRKVKKVRVKKISVDIELDHGCDCD